MANGSNYSLLPTNGETIALTPDTIRSLLVSNTYARENDENACNMVKEGFLKTCTDKLVNGNTEEKRLAAEGIFIISCVPGQKVVSEPGCVQGW